MSAFVEWLLVALVLAGAAYAVVADVRGMRRADREGRGR
jgi:hypothetical protein